MFVAIVIGVVILSTFLYTFFLMYYIGRYKVEFENDKNVYSSEDTTAIMNNITTEIKNILEKDPISNAFNSMILEKIMTREFQRAKRYKLELSIIRVEFNSIKDDEYKVAISNFGAIVNNKIRNQDSFGVVNKNSYMILLPSTPVSGATILAERIYEKTKETFETDNMHLDINFGITEVSKSDSIESITEKIEDAIDNAKSKGNGQIEIEI
jgi:CPA1 family monovalent cation:H+ antiporter